MTQLVERGDILPSLEVVMAADVEPGDVFWGFQRRSQTSWVLNHMAVPVEQTPRRRMDNVVIADFVLRAHDLVLIELRSRP